MRLFKSLDELKLDMLTKYEKRYTLRQWFRLFALKEPERSLQHGQAMTDRQLEQYETKLLNPDI